jgi:hypothetical protein
MVIDKATQTETKTKQNKEVPVKRISVKRRRQ